MKQRLGGNTVHPVMGELRHKLDLSGKNRFVKITLLCFMFTLDYLLGFGASWPILGLVQFPWEGLAKFSSVFALGVFLLVCSPQLLPTHNSHCEVCNYIIF